MAWGAARDRPHQRPAGGRGLPSALVSSSVQGTVLPALPVSHLNPMFLFPEKLKSEHVQPKPLFINLIPILRGNSTRKLWIHHHDVSHPMDGKTRPRGSRAHVSSQKSPGVPKRGGSSRAAGPGPAGLPHATLRLGPAWTGAKAEGPMPSRQRASVSLPGAGCGQAGRPPGGPASRQPGAGDALKPHQQTVSCARHFLSPDVNTQPRSENRHSSSENTGVSQGEKCKKQLQSLAGPPAKPGVQASRCPGRRHVCPGPREGLGQSKRGLCPPSSQVVM